MAFSNQQAGRTRIVITVVGVICIAAIVVIVAFGMNAAGSANTSVPADTGSAVSNTAADASDASNTDTSADSGTTSDEVTMDEIDAQYGTAANKLHTQYESDPSNPTALLNLANGYFDWGVAAINHATTDEETDHARSLLSDAVGYYDTYLESNPEAKAAMVDRAICVFYTGDHAKAITQLEDLTQNLDSTFAPAWANLGMFYESDGRTDDAKQAYQTAIDAAGDDDAYNVKDYAQSRLNALNGAQ